MLSHLVKSGACLAALLAQSLFAQTSADYQAAIREAIEAYRGDCTEHANFVVCEEWYDPTSGTHTPQHATNVFPPEAFALSLPVGENRAFTSASLQHATSNQTLELTATRRALTLFR